MAEHQQQSLASFTTSLLLKVGARYHVWGSCAGQQGSMTAVCLQAWLVEAIKVVGGYLTCFMTAGSTTTL
jgi:hypothetical protein